MRLELETAGYPNHVTAINVINGESSMGLLTSKCNFDCLQDVPYVGAWNLMGGGKDDIYVFRQGGRLSPGGYFSASGPRNSNLSTEEGYRNVYDTVVAASKLGAGEPCPGDPPAEGLQRPGNFNQDGEVDLSDSIALLDYLFLGENGPLPCEAADLDGEGNLSLLDVNGDRTVDISDPLYLLNFLFLGSPPPHLGTNCIGIPGCPDACPG